MIVALSVVLVSLAFAQLLSIRFSTQCPDELFLELEELTRAGQVKRAAEVAASDPSALALT